MKELQDIARLSDRFISVELVDESLFDWNVKLHQVDKDSVLWQDMKETNTEFILLNLTFPDNFPFSPPFMRVLSPRLENGYVLDGGAICMELLTPRGWSSAYTVEAVMRQFAASLVKGQGRICRKAGKSKKSFSRKEAEATFKSLVKTHEKYGQNESLSNKFDVSENANDPPEKGEEDALSRAAQTLNNTSRTPADWLQQIRKKPRRSKDNVFREVPLHNERQTRERKECWEAERQDRKENAAFARQATERMIKVMEDQTEMLKSLIQLQTEQI
ncbi:unnamed protein product [Caretta caretta]